MNSMRWPPRAKASSEHSRRIVNEFLTQLDGVLAQNRDVLVLAASNMPWDVDSAMKRSGRFARQVFVPPPDAAAREYLFRLKLDGVPSEAMDLPALARATPFYAGADIEGLIDLAKERVIAHALDTGDERPLHQRDLLEAVAEYPASTLEWLRTARNLVRYGGDGGYRELEQYLKVSKLL
jgi:SpoVK/Ycf46/Vps4 family AAA+-type ATPase